MRKLCFISLLVMLMATPLMVSCERSDNGDLDGMWLLTRMDSVQVNKSYDVRSRRITWSFQAKIMQCFNYNDDKWKDVLMTRFRNEGTQLVIFDPFLYNRMDGDIPLTADSVHYLAPHCINCVPDTFQLEKLDKSTLIIADDVLRLSFEKY